MAFLWPFFVFAWKTALRGSYSSFSQSSFEWSLKNPFAFYRKRYMFSHFGLILIGDHVCSLSRSCGSISLSILCFPTWLASLFWYSEYLFCASSGVISSGCLDEKLVDESIGAKNGMIWSWDGGHTDLLRLKKIFVGHYAVSPSTGARPATAMAAASTRTMCRFVGELFWGTQKVIA